MKKITKVLAIVMSVATVGVSSIGVEAASFGVYYTPGAPSYNNNLTESNEIKYNGTGGVTVNVSSFNSSSSAAYLYFTGSSTLQNNSFKSTENNSYIPIIGTKPKQGQMITVTARIANYSGNSISAFGSVWA